MIGSRVDQKGKWPRSFALARATGSQAVGPSSQNPNPKFCTLILSRSLLVASATVSHAVGPNNLNPNPNPCKLDRRRLPVHLAAQTASVSRCPAWPRHQPCQTATPRTSAPARDFLGFRVLAHGQELRVLRVPPPLREIFWGLGCGAHGSGFRV